MKNGQTEVVVITGASAGVGRATAREFAKHGARIALLARGLDGLKAAAREVEELGGSALIIPTDVSDAKQIEAALELAETNFGPIDVWVNNAMVSVFSPFIEMEASDFKRVTEVTYLGYVYSTLCALKRMVPRNRGVIVQVGSALSYRSIPLQSAYCGAKHAINGFTDSIRSELIREKSKVHLTTVQMPALNTPQFGWVKSRLPRKPQPVPPIYQPEVAARAIYWAAHHHRRELYVGISTAIVITLNKFFALIGDYYLAKTGFDSQQTQEPVDANRQNNLWEPLAGDHGAHGTFDKKAHAHSPQVWFTEHRALVAMLLVIFLAAVFIRFFR